MTRESGERVVERVARVSGERVARESGERVARESG